MQFANLRTAMPLVTLADCTLVFGAGFNARGSFNSTGNASGRSHHASPVADGKVMVLPSLL
jgi:hypothetical protein